jgi:lysophospholipase L1-like esterase
LALLVLEVGVRLIVGVSGKNQELASFQGEPLLVSAYRLRYLDQAGNPIPGIPMQGDLTIKHSPVMGYRLVGNQQQAAWKINEQGFRTDRPLPLEKPGGEVRIFVLGGSTAFGQLVSNNEATFAQRLENRLNQQVSAQKSNPKQFRPDTLPFYADELDKVLALPPRIRDRQYRVINAAVPGYVSSNELAQLTFNILPYKPDFIVLLDGYSDLLLPSQRDATDIPGTEALLNNVLGHVWTRLTQVAQGLFYESYIVRGFQYWVLKPQEGLKQVIPPDTDGAIAAKLPTDAYELNHRTSRYQRNVTQIARLSSAAKVPLLVALQPEVTGRSPQKLSNREKQIIAQLGSGYSTQIKSAYDDLARSLDLVKQDVRQGVTTLNLYDAYANYQGEAFQDAIHLTDAAHGVLSDRLYDALSKQLQQQPKPYPGAEPPAQ